MKKITRNLTDHRFALGAKVEYGFLGPNGGDRLGEVAREQREYGRDGYLIRPLSGGPGEGYLPSVYPGDMVVPWTPARWRYEASSHMSGYVRTYAEIERNRKPCRECGGGYWQEYAGPPARDQLIPHESSCSRNVAAQVARQRT